MFQPYKTRINLGAHLSHLDMYDLQVASQENDSDPISMFRAEGSNRATGHHLDTQTLKNHSKLSGNYLCVLQVFAGQTCTCSQSELSLRNSSVPES